MKDNIKDNIKKILAKYNKCDNNETNIYFWISLDSTPAATVSLNCEFDFDSEQYNISIDFDGDNEGDDAFALFTDFEAYNDETDEYFDRDEDEDLYQKLIDDARSNFEDSCKLKTSDLCKAINHIYEFVNEHDSGVDEDDMSLVEELYMTIK